MNCELISQRHDAQEAATELGHGCPEPEAVAFLWLAADCVLDGANAHLLGELRAARQNIMLEVFGELEIRHLEECNRLPLADDATPSTDFSSPRRRRDRVLSRYSRSSWLR